MSTLVERIKLSILINSCITKIKKPSDMVVAGNFKNKGKFSDVFACNFDTSLTSGTKQYFCIKIIPISQSAKNNQHDTRFSTWRELMALRWCTMISKSHITQNLPIIYDYFMIRDIPHLNKYIEIGTEHKRNKIGLKRYNIVLLNELSHMDIHTWVTHELPQSTMVDKSLKFEFEKYVDIWKQHQNYIRQYTLCIINDVLDISPTVLDNLRRIKNTHYKKHRTAIDTIDKVLIHNGSHTVDEWYNAYFQIFSAVYVIQKKMKMFHNDLHWGNVLVTQINKNKKFDSINNSQSDSNEHDNSGENDERGNGYWKYVVDGVSYYIPNMGYIFKIWDFGLARSDYYVPMETWNSKIDPNKFQMMFEQEHNYEYDEIYRKVFGMDTIRISNIPKWCANNNDDKFYGQCPIEFIEQFVKPIHKIVRDKKDTRPQILMLKLFGLYRHDKIGCLVSEHIAKQIIDFEKSVDIDTSKLVVGQLGLIKLNEVYKFVEINCLLPNERDKIQVLYERCPTTYTNIDVNRFYVLNRTIRTSYEINNVPCLGVFDLDKKVNLVQRSGCGCDVINTTHPMVQSITEYVDNFKRMEYSRRFD